MKKCIVLCSSGIDSTSCLYWAKRNYESVLALFIDYGQKNRAEEAAFRRIVFATQVSYMILRYDLRQIGGSALTDDISVPKDRSKKEISTGIPITWVPLRNLFFLGLAGAVAQVKGFKDIVIAVNVIDFSGYPDCTPPFIESMEGTLRVALDNFYINIITPVLRKRKAEIIKFGLENGADFSNTLSCYEGEIPCGIPKNSYAMSVEEIQNVLKGCDSCQLRMKGFRELKMLDPLLVRLRKEGRI